MSPDPPGVKGPTLSLYERLQESRSAEDARANLLDGLRQGIHERVIARLGPVFYSNRADTEQLRSSVQRIVEEALKATKTPLSVSESAQLAREVTDDVLGHGPIERLLQDPTVTEVMVNGPGRVFVERNGKIELTQSRFLDEDHLRHVIGRIVAAVGRHIDETTPMVDARLPDGSRVNAVFPPLSIDGPYLTVRKFSVDALTVEDLIGFGTLTVPVARLLEAAVRGKMNILVSGGTSTGKTTLLNVLSSFIPSDERIITIEDSKELQLRQAHVLSLEARPPNTEGKGEVAIRDLLRNSLRMRPDRILIGECRAGEALDMLQAMNTGHEGSLTTVHANSPRDALSRVETMTMMAGFDLPVRVVRDQMSSALDLIVHLSRQRDGSRRVTHVTEIGRMEGEVILLQDIFLFDFGMGTDDHGNALGQLKATGLRPRFSETLLDRGIEIDSTLFDAEQFLHDPAGRR